MTDFWKGYTRNREMSRRLSVAVIEAMRAYPDQRLGQIIENALRINVGERTDLFRVYDETLLESLRRYTSQADG